MNNQKQFFDISLACDLMGKSINQVLKECAAFDPQLFTANSLLEDNYKTFQHLLKLAEPSVADSDIDVVKSFFDIFDAKVCFHCYFELQDYEAFSFVGIHFINNTAVECIISLGKPTNPKRYASELEATKVFLVSLEELYLNGRIQEESETGTKVYTWKKDDRTAVSFISYPPSGSPKDTGVHLSVQIRDTQLHPQGAYFELLYNQAQKYIRDLVGVLGDESEPIITRRVDTAVARAIEISPKLEAFCREYIEVLGRALDRAMRFERKEYEAGFYEAMDMLSLDLFHRVPKKDIPQMLAEVKRYAEESIVRIPYNRLSPLNQFLVTIPPYVFYCLEKYLSDDPGLQEEAKCLMNTTGFPRYLQEDLGYSISQEIKGAFWIPNPLAFLRRLFGLGRRR